MTSAPDQGQAGGARVVGLESSRGTEKRDRHPLNDRPDLTTRRLDTGLYLAAPTPAPAGSRRFAGQGPGHRSRMTDPTASPRAEFAPPPAMPSILASAVLETRAVLALSRRTVGLLLTRS